MRSLPLFKFGPRARSTSWGIALCTMFIVASFSVVSGLNNSMEALERNFETDLSLVAKPGPAGNQFFERDAVSSLIPQAAFGIYTLASVGSHGQIGLLAAEGNLQLLPGIPEVQGNEMLAGPDSRLVGNLTLTGRSTAVGVVVGTYQSPISPSDWYLCGMPLVENLTGSSGLRNFAIAENLTTTNRESLVAGGFSVQAVIGIIDFLGSGVDEVQADVTWALVPSVFVIAVLAYSFLGTETADKRHEIGVVKTLGAGRWKVLRYLMSDALLISAWGGLLGIALGIVLSYGMSTAASSIFSSVFVIKSSEVLLVEAYIATICAGLAGALLPAVRMTLSSPVEDLKEVAPYS